MANNNFKESVKRNDCIGIDCFESEDSIIFSKEEFTVSGNDNGHDFVDLGLPSGIKWATCNVGAASQEEYGEFYAWGETRAKEEYTPEDYYFFDEMDEDEDSYCDDGDTLWSISKYTDADAVLERKDDTATINWGEHWRMPTYKECKELIDNCEIMCGLYKSVKGFKIKGPNGNSIFLPAAGYHDEESGLDMVGKIGVYWSSSLQDESGYWGDVDDFYYARPLYLFINENEAGRWLDARNIGESVRPVFVQK